MNSTTLFTAPLMASALLSVSSSTPPPEQINLSTYTSVYIDEQNLIGVAPEALDWWWDNLNSTERYLQMDPDHHLDFTLISAATDLDDLSYTPGVQFFSTEQLTEGALSTLQTYWSPEAYPSAQREAHRFVSKLEFPEISLTASEPTEGWLIHSYQANAALDGTQIATTLVLPNQLEQQFPGTSEQVAINTQAELLGLSKFLPQLFQEELVQNAHESRGSYTIKKPNWFQKQITVNQEIKHLTPEMMNWWWDNINTTARYKQWHPTAHKSFKWLVEPSQPDNLTYSVGAVQRVVEDIGPYEQALKISWLDPSEAPEALLKYPDYVYGETDLDNLLGGILPQNLLHQYQLNPSGDGILMQSDFSIPVFLDWVMPGFSQRLAEHAQQEMQFLSYFLPDLYEREYSDRQ